MTGSIYYNPAQDVIQLVRWYLGDTETDAFGAVTNPLVTDIEIIFALSQKGQDAKAAAAFCARYAAIKLINQPQSVRLLDFAASVGSTSSKDLAEHYLKLADQLEHETKRPGVYVGGASISDKQAAEQDTDRAPSFFKRGLHDYVGEA